MSWLIRLLFSCAGIIAVWFVSRTDEPRFSIMEFIVVLLLLLIAAVATLYFSAIRGFVWSLLPKRDQADPPLAGNTKRPVL